MINIVIKLCIDALLDNTTGAALILIPVITAAGLEVQSTSDSHAYSVKLLPAGMLEIH